MTIQTKFNLKQKVYWFGESQICSNTIAKIVVTVTPSGTIYEDYYFMGGHRISIERLFTTKEELLKTLKAE